MEPRSGNLWGLRSAEAVGQHLLDLDIGLPVDRLRPLVRRAPAGDAETEDMVLEAVNRRGRPVTVGVTCSPLPAVGAEPGGIIAMEVGEFVPGRGGHPSDRSEV